MKALLILLTAISILGALFVGGCSVQSVGEYLWHGPRGEYPSLQRSIAWVSGGVGLVAAAVLAANIWVLRAFLGRPSPWRRTLAGGLALMDVVSAVGSLTWILWADTWGWADWTWTSLAKAGAVALALKGVLIWRLVGMSATAAKDARES